MADSGIYLYGDLVRWRLRDIERERAAAAGRNPRGRAPAAELARELGYSEAWLSLRLNGQKPIDSKILKRIAFILDIDAALLIAPEMADAA